MKLVSVALTFGALVVGLIAAWYWYRASKVLIIPMHEVAGVIEPVDPIQSHASWTAGLLMTAEKAGRLNKTAALWTAASVALGAAANFAGSLAS